MRCRRHIYAPQHSFERWLRLTNRTIAQQQKRDISGFFGDNP
jgi:hypothetical protein